MNGNCKPLEQRLEEYTELRDGCLVWTGYQDRDGYGIACIKLDGDSRSKNRKVHRLVYAAAHGEIPDGMMVRHKCDNPSCVNLDHLEIGTPSENMRDRDTRGRGNFSRDVSGAKNPRAKLSDDDVAYIREHHEAGARLGEFTTAKMAAKFSVHTSQIQRVVRREHWL